MYCFTLFVGIEGSGLFHKLSLVYPLVYPSRDISEISLTDPLIHSNDFLMVMGRARGVY